MVTTGAPTSSNERSQEPFSHGTWEMCNQLPLIQSRAVESSR
jgi:hypothetical protein